MKAVAYVRVSDASQIEGHSLDAQERLFKELCKNRGWEPFRSTVKKVNRPTSMPSPAARSSGNFLMM